MGEYQPVTRNEKIRMEAFSLACDARRACNYLHQPKLAEIMGEAEEIEAWVLKAGERNVPRPGSAAERLGLNPSIFPTPGHPESRVPRGGAPNIALRDDGGFVIDEGEGRRTGWFSSDVSRRVFMSELRNGGSEALRDSGPFFVWIDIVDGGLRMTWGEQTFATRKLANAEGRRLAEALECSFETAFATDASGRAGSPIFPTARSVEGSAVVVRDCLLIGGHKPTVSLEDGMLVIVEGGANADVGRFSSDVSRRVVLEPAAGGARVWIEVHGDGESGIATKWGRQGFADMRDAIVEAQRLAGACACVWVTLPQAGKSPYNFTVEQEAWLAHLTRHVGGGTAAGQSDLIGLYYRSVVADIGCPELPTMHMASCREDALALDEDGNVNRWESGRGWVKVTEFPGFRLGSAPSDVCPLLWAPGTWPPAETVAGQSAAE